MFKLCCDVHPLYLHVLEHIFISNYDYTLIDACITTMYEQSTPEAKPTPLRDQEEARWNGSSPDSWRFQPRLLSFISTWT